MQDEEVLAEFRASKALLEGHFLLSSGRHSAYYLQCARVLMDPDRASRLAIALTGKLPRDLRKEIGKVVSPAMGGVIIGHEMGRALSVEAMFVERPTGTFELRRGFALNPGDKVITDNLQKLQPGMPVRIAGAAPAAKTPPAPPAR